LNITVPWDKDYARSFLKDQGHSVHVPYWIFYALLKNFSHGDVIIAGKEQQNLGMCSALGAFEQGSSRIFIMSTPAVPGDFGFSSLIRRKDQVSWRSKHPLLIGHLCIPLRIVRGNLIGRFFG
jgi:hypothetical protein